MIEKLIAIEYSDLAQLASIIEHDSAKEDGWEDQPNVQEDRMATKFVQGKPYTCRALTPSKGKEVANPEKKATVWHFQD